MSTSSPVVPESPRPSRVAYPLFSGLPDAQVDEVLQRMDTLAFAPNQVALHEFERNDRIFLIESGEFEVWKGRPHSDQGVCVARLRAGDCFGEMSAVAREPAAATIVARTPATVRFARLTELPAAQDFRQIVTENLSHTLVRRLSQANESISEKHRHELETMRVVAAASAFITRMLTALTCYMFSLPLIAVLTPLLPSNSLISFLIIVVFSWVVLNFRYRWPEIAGRHWQMTTVGWPRALARGLLWTIPPGLAFLAVKSSVMYMHPGEYQFFEPMTAIARGAPMNYPLWITFALIYTALSFAQEYIRCAIQGTLAMIHSALGSRGPWKSILISNVVFASIHLHLGAAFTAQAFIAGLFFGYEFHRERSYLSVAISHSVFGVWAVFVVGLPR